MRLDPDICHAAMSSRDPRFDGRFFFGVLTTGIYCRPVCPARTPLLKSTVFFLSAAAAVQAGFRACRRCRPETAPGSPAWQGTAATVSRALRLIDAGALDGGVLGGSVPQLAARLGIGARQLRKLFQQHLGAAPSTVAQIRRLSAARLLLDTALPMSEVAHAAGYGSVRRFNDAVQAAFGCAPSALRRDKTVAGVICVPLPYRPPLDLDAHLTFLAPRAVPGIERIEPGSWSHMLPSGEWLSVQQCSGKNALALSVPISAALALPAIVCQIRRVFDLDLDPQALAQRVPIAPAGLRLPCAFDPFVGAMRVVVGQHISVSAANTIAGRVVERWGYPDPKILAEAPLEQVGIPSARARGLRELSQAVAEGTISLQVSADPEAQQEALMKLYGIGPWTAAVIAMRITAEPDAFPASDLGLRRATGMSTAQLLQRAEVWRPFRAYAAQAIWGGAQC